MAIAKVLLQSELKKKKSSKEASKKNFNHSLMNWNYNSLLQIHIR